MIYYNGSIYNAGRADREGYTLIVNYSLSNTTPLRLVDVHPLELRMVNYTCEHIYQWAYFNYGLMFLVLGDSIHCPRMLSGWNDADVRIKHGLLWDNITSKSNSEYYIKQKIDLYMKNR